MKMVPMQTQIPYHILAVHAPIILAVVLPFFTISLAIFIAKHPEFRRIWIIAILLHVILSLSIYGAMALGESAKESIEKDNASAIVRERLEEHEERAELFFLMSLLALCMAVPAAKRNHASVYFQILTIGLQIAVLLLCIRTGHEGTKIYHGSLQQKEALNRTICQHYDSRCDDKKTNHLQ